MLLPGDLAARGVVHADLTRCLNSLDSPILLLSFAVPGGCRNLHIWCTWNCRASFARSQSQGLFCRCSLGQHVPAELARTAALLACEHGRRTRLKCTGRELICLLTLSLLVSSAVYDLFRLPFCLCVDFFLGVLSAPC